MDEDNKTAPQDERAAFEALPPLPKPAGTMPGYFVVGPNGDGGNLLHSRGGDLIQSGLVPSGQFTADQMRAYALAALSQHAAEQAEPDYAAMEREHFGDPEKQTGVYAPKQAEQKALRDADACMDDVRRLTRELDVLLNGEEGAAEQASLCDLVAQVRARQAEQQAGPVVERVERLKFDLRQVMIDYGAAERAQDEERIRETSTRGVALIDSLAPITHPAPSQERDKVDAERWRFAICLPWVLTGDAEDFTLSIRIERTPEMVGLTDPEAIIDAARAAGKEQG